MFKIQYEFRETPNHQARQCFWIRRKSKIVKPRSKNLIYSQWTVAWRRNYGTIHLSMLKIYMFYIKKGLIGNTPFASYCMIHTRMCYRKHDFWKHSYRKHFYWTGIPKIINSVQHLIDFKNIYLLITIYNWRLAAS